ncbi:MAG: formylglycine-generating enzyme family protein, partial [Gammaproteobacteria bacterium]
LGGSWATWSKGWVIAPDVKLDYAVRVDGDKIIYEVGIPQLDNYGQISGGQTVPTDLKVGHVVAFDVIADTRHSAGFGMLSENMMIEKFRNADRFDHYILSGSIASPPHKPLSCDLNRSQVIDIWDLHIMADNWLAHPTPEPPITWVYVIDPGVPGHEGFTGYMSKYETTNAQYCEYLNATLASGDIVIQNGKVYGNSGPYKFWIYYGMDDSGAQISYSGAGFYVESRDGYSMADHPVTMVSWYGATAFCSYYGFRLPTRWEWRAVADYDGSYTYGCGTTIDHSKANYSYLNGVSNPLGLSSYPYTTPVYYYPSYGYGMNDMSGNVWEWTSSVHSPFQRVYCGGSFLTPDWYCYATSNWYTNESGTGGEHGFRVCR